MLPVAMHLITHKRETRVLGLPLRTLLIRLAVTIGALFVAAHIVPGVYLAGWQAAILAGAICGLINLAIQNALGTTGTIMRVLSLGLFLLVVNLVALAATAWIAAQTRSIQFRIDGFGALCLGALLITVLSWLATLIIVDK